MAEDWRTAYGRVKMELEEYRETIVPALMDKIKELEKQGVAYEARQKTYTNAVIAYGERNQMVVALEELSECQKEICKYLRGNGIADNMAEEIADAMICLEQVQYFLGLDELVRKKMDQKVERLDNRLRRDAHGQT